MADAKISQLPVATTPLAGTELVPVVQGGVTVQTTVGDVLTGAVPSGTANGVLYLNGSKVVTSGSALTFDGSNFGVVGSTGASGAVAVFTTVDNPAAGRDFLRFVRQGGGTVGSIEYSQANSLGVNSTTATLFKIGGSEQMRLDSTGLGIGTSSPSYKLDVSGTDGVTARVKSTSGTTGNYAQLILDSYNSFSGTGQAYIRGVSSASGNSNTDLTFGVNSSGFGAPYEAMRLDSSGNLGIGTSSPSNLLTIGGSTGGIDFSGWNNDRVVLKQSFDASYYQQIVLDAANRDFRLQSNSSDSTARISFWTGGSGTIAERMRIDASGNLGLGVTPSGWGSGFVALDIDAVTSLACEQDVTTVLGQNCYNNGGWKYRVTNIFGVSRYDQFNGAHIWQTAPSGTAGNPISFSQVMTLDASGNLVVGTTTADSARLTVMGGSGGMILDDGNGRKLKFDPPGSINSNTAFIGTTTPHALRINSGTSTNEGVLIFSTENTERARITSGGDLLVGDTSSNGAGRLEAKAADNTSPAIVARSGSASDESSRVLLCSKFSATTTTSQVFVQFSVDNNTTASGQINANGANSVAFGTWSDVRLKKNISDLPPQLANIMALRPVEFDYIESEGGGHQISFIAQELEKVYPDSVGERADGMKTLTGWDKTTARLVKAIQEQQTIIEDLRARLAAAGI